MQARKVAMLLVIISWVVIGLLVGFIATKLVNLRGDDPIIGIACSVAGAVAGGIGFSYFSENGVAEWNLWSMLGAAVGAAAGAALYHAIRSRSIGREQQTIRRSY